MNKETYQKSVNILLDSYNNGSLKAGHCAKCAVGNLLDGNMLWGCKFTTVNGIQHSSKTFLNDQKDELLKYNNIDVTEINYDKVIEILDELYNQKGYTEEELKSIEYAFENSIWIEAEKDEDKYDHLAKSKKGQLIALTAALQVMESMIDNNEVVETDKNIEKLNFIAREKYHIIVN